MTDFNFLTTHIGSVPHKTADELTARLAAQLDIPAWLQLPRRDFRESIYTQYAPTLPGVVIDEKRERALINTGADDFDSALESFYQAVMDENAERCALKHDFAQGFFAALKHFTRAPAHWLKGQVMGPVSLGLSVTDQNLRACLYDETLADVFVKHTSMNARWQIRQLRSVSSNVILFVDEPYMASFGSALINLNRAGVIAYLDEVFGAIHNEGATAGVHCCANTDWSVLLATQVDILNLDAHGFIESLALYPHELRAFLDRGGVVCWGIVPNSEQIMHETPAMIADALRTGLKLIADKAAARGVNISAAEFAARSLIAPACGLGSASIDIAEKVFDALAETGMILKKG
jgi:hypothetical protein